MSLVFAAATAIVLDSICSVVAVKEVEIVDHAFDILVRVVDLFATSSWQQQQIENFSAFRRCIKVFRWLFQWYPLCIVANVLKAGISKSPPFLPDPHDSSN